MLRYASTYKYTALSQSIFILLGHTCHITCYASIISHVMLPITALCQTPDQQQATIRELTMLLSKRPEGVCNFVEGASLSHFDTDCKVVYRHYATLYFAVVVDARESELGILDLVQGMSPYATPMRCSQPRYTLPPCPNILACVLTSSAPLSPRLPVLVEALDRRYENVCELDIIHHSDEVLSILDEIVMGGMVLETNIEEVQAALAEQEKLEKATRRASVRR